MRTIQEVAERLAAMHRAEDPGTTHVFLAKGDATREPEVRLVEVSESVGPTGDVLPFAFLPRADLGIDFRSAVVVLSLDEWAQIKDGRLKLPEGWGTTSDLQELAA